MWLPVSTVVVLCVVLDGTVSKDNDLENMFRQRSSSDWQEAWHHEKFTRCRDTLIQHLYWACEKDIYRLSRRSEKPRVIKLGERYEYDKPPWISVMRARQLVRSRRGGSSITSECCSSSGCTWEEYAEYCPTNKRHTVFVD
ncbi:probable insulin-like peptide 7 [Photinus pyralis]|uniref:probable insulin-like peptide 7 n=1 Tax=Photinus pyralis TaxID=7054 RepID=UPI001267400B|nr:probable insulin-like peptide 7 [Photinus pyralis]